MSHIFFSYSRKDKALAEEIIQQLRSVGFVIWQDVSSIRGGENWLRAIQQGIAEAAAVVVLWSKHASESQWVGREIDLAQVGEKSLIPLLHDDTALPSGLTLSNGLPVNDRERLIRDLPQDVRRKRTGLTLDSAIDQQTVDGVETWKVDGVELVSVPLLTSSYSRAAVVAPAGTVLEEPGALHLCLHFTRSVDKVLVSDVFRQVRAENPEATFVALHITGPVALGSYRLDDDNPAQWSDAVDTTTEALSVLSQTRRPELHVYMQTPVALAFGLGTKFWRFWRIALYNWTGGDGDVKYRRVMELIPER
jgi:hypothetical protein